MSTMSITIEGQAFEQGIPASTLKALVDFQRVVYKAYAMKNGISVRSLSRDDRRRLEIIFEIRRGSLIIDFFMNEFAPELLKVITDDVAHSTLEQFREHYSDLFNSKYVEYFWDAGVSVLLDRITGFHKGNVTKFKIGGKILKNLQIGKFKDFLKKTFKKK